MLRKSGLNHVLTVLAVMTLASPGLAASAATPQSPVVARGVLRDSAGKLSRGSVILYLDELRDHNRMTVVQVARVSSNGSYQIRMNPDSRVKALAEANNNHVNFMMVALSSNGRKMSSARFFTSILDGRTWKTATSFDWLGRNSSASKIKLRTNILAPTSFTRAVRAKTQGIQVAAASSSVDWNCEWKLVGTYDAYSPVIETHSWNGLTVTATYGRRKTADSEFGVAIKYPGKAWSIDGSVHVGTKKESSVEESVTRTGKNGYVWGSEFRFKRWHQDPWWSGAYCAGVPRDVVEAVRWNSGMKKMWDDSRFDGQCQTTYKRYATKRPAHSSWKRSSSNFTWYSWSLGGGLGPLGITMKAQSGASEHVTVEYKTGNSPAVICGNNDKPAYSTRIFAGQKPNLPRECRSVSPAFVASKPRSFKPACV